MVKKNVEFQWVYRLLYFQIAQFARGAIDQIDPAPDLPLSCLIVVTLGSETEASKLAHSHHSSVAV